MIIANYTVIETGKVYGGRAVGFAGSIKSASGIADRHNVQTGLRCYVTEYGREISGKILYDTGSKS